MSVEQDDCPHCRPVFDAEKAKDMTDQEVRRAYPRFSGKCEQCGFHGIRYASFEQYILGDY